MSQKKALVFLSSSAGELDWVLPIIDYLLDNNFNIEIIYRTKSAKKSVEDNSYLSDYLEGHKQINQASVGQIAKNIYRLKGISYKVRLKLKKYSLPSCWLDIFDNIFDIVHVKGIVKSIVGHTENDKYLIFSGVTTLKHSTSRFRYLIKKEFSTSIFFYHPHGVNIHTEGGLSYSDCAITDRNREYILYGDPNDAQITKRSAYDISGAIPICIGHPKYSDKWLASFGKKNRRLNSNHVVKILLISTGVGTAFTQDEYRVLIDLTIKVIHEKFPNYQLIVRKHPRELDTSWDIASKQNKSIIIIKESILEVAGKVDFAITFRSTASIDCFVMGVPVIEFNCFMQKLIDQFGYEQANRFRELGVVLSADNENELKSAISKIISQNYRISAEMAHPFLSEIIKRSNNWEKYFKSVLNVNDVFLE